MALHAWHCALALYVPTADRTARGVPLHGMAWHGTRAVQAAAAVKVASAEQVDRDACDEMIGQAQSLAGLVGAHEATALMSALQEALAQWQVLLKENRAAAMAISNVGRFK